MREVIRDTVYTRSKMRVRTSYGQGWGRMRQICAPSRRRRSSSLRTRSSSSSSLRQVNKIYQQEIDEPDVLRVNSLRRGSLLGGASPTTVTRQLAYAKPEERDHRRSRSGGKGLRSSGLLQGRLPELEQLGLGVLDSLAQNV